MRFILAALATALLLAGCKSSSGPSSNANVIFVQWLSYGSDGATGSLKNSGSATAHHVYVKTHTSYETWNGNATPFDIPAGGTATFHGAGSGPGLIAAPSVDKIGWD